ncbi:MULTISPECIES: hypothetical protein [Rhodobacterales]|uniref:hypothetical protein n=1 Tax=Rhodobacterales TaxID=204455 RepID=UPI00237F3998|nr:hypothetical protein [Phaeobacter gallaeciensis]MDE4142125.1 hypothetical protein [Phaeobacter gallaeciensis]MDE4150570.1 hypothetical protein [Phaeobacter gallaeciensis]MDE4154587.1 hypothetical protein [Phaeobacter gallaeciensis]MDE4229978.1 hypothetical protein [Phaeobacter gallaeciensis]MDE4259263.1 hypothetical protein [Phaeobacter gallaeciensis]
MTEQRKREPIWGDFWGHNFGPLKEPEEARKAMRWALLVVIWIAGSMAFFAHATQGTGGYLVAAALASLAVPVYLGKRAFVLIAIILGAVVFGYEVYIRLMSATFNGFVVHLILAYALLQAFRGWRYRPITR